MDVSFDEKGKVFTSIITKKPIRVVILTINGRVKGTMHIRQDARLLDELTLAGHFIAITDVVVLNQHGDVIHRADFLALNQNHIVWLIPEEDINVG